MRAPKPTLLLSATRYFILIEGTWESYREAKRLYTRLDEPAKVSIIDALYKLVFSDKFAYIVNDKINTHYL